MPKVSVNEHNCIDSGQNYVWPSGESFDVRLKANTMTAQFLSDQPLKTRISTTNSGHTVAALLGRKIIGHRANYFSVFF
jgi:hypothetical protein